MNLLFVGLSIGFAMILSFSIGIALYGKEKIFYYIAIWSAAAMVVFANLAG